MRVICGALFSAVIGTAAGAVGYSDHRRVAMFTDQPCGDVLTVIDEGPIVDMGMAWGFILGFDTARGGLNDDETTTLERLRAACDEDPDRTAAEILESF